MERVTTVTWMTTWWWFRYDTSVLACLFDSSPRDIRTRLFSSSKPEHLHSGTYAHIQAKDRFIVHKWCYVVAYLAREILARLPRTCALFFFIAALRSPRTWNSHSVSTQASDQSDRNSFNFFVVVCFSFVGSFFTVRVLPDKKSWFFVKNVTVGACRGPKTYR